MRELNCRPGDLAIIIDALAPDTIGMIVKVLSRHRTRSADDVIWLVQAPQPMTYEKAGKISHRKKGPVLDSSLHPIRGYPLGQDIAVAAEE